MRAAFPDVKPPATSLDKDSHSRNKSCEKYPSPRYPFSLECQPYVLEFMPAQRGVMKSARNFVQRGHFWRRLLLKRELKVLHVLLHDTQEIAFDGHIPRRIKHQAFYP